MSKKQSDAEREFEREWRRRYEDAQMIISPASIRFHSVDEREEALMTELHYARSDNMKLLTQHQTMVKRMKTATETINSQTDAIDNLAEQLRVANMKLATCQCNYEIRPQGIVIVEPPPPVCTPLWIAVGLAKGALQFSVVAGIMWVLFMLGVPSEMAIWPALFIGLGIPWIHNLVNNRS